MCRSTEYEHEHEHVLHPSHRPRRLKFNSLFLRLPCSAAAGGAAALPETLSLVFLPRINSSPLHVNSSKIRGDTPAFLTLHRVLTTSDFDVVYAARDHVRASDGLSFEVHLGQHRFLKGVFRAHQHKHEDEDEDEDEDQHDCHRHSIAWRIECKCVLLHTSEIGGLLPLGEPEAELSVAVDGAGDLNLLRSKFNIVNLHSSSSSSRRRGRRRCRTFKMCLEDIPEAQEEELSIHHQSASGTTADDDDGGCSSEDDDGVPAVDYIDMDAVEWAVDVGFWVMCLGMGILLSRASANTFTRKTFLL